MLFSFNNSFHPTLNNTSDNRQCGNGHWDAGQCDKGQWDNKVGKQWTMGPWTLVQWTHGRLDRGTMRMEQWGIGESHTGTVAQWANGARGPWSTGQCPTAQCHGSSALDEWMTEHQWSSGRTHRCHRCDPGSNPGCSIFLNAYLLSSSTCLTEAQAVPRNE